MSIDTTDEGHFCLWDDTTGMAFGPVFESDAHAIDYLAYIKRDSPAAYRFWPESLHREYHDRWFDERCDPETGALKS